MVRQADFDPAVALPRGLTIPAINKTIAYIERELAELIDIYFDQANLFSALVSNFAIRGLNANSEYERHRHADLAQQRFPDLKRRGSGTPPGPQDSLECKASKRPWELQSHYDHAGWYMVWRYLVDPTCSWEPGHPLIVWRVDCVFLAKDDWKYEGSKAGATGGGRTHTFGLKSARAKLNGKAVYQRADTILSGGKPILRNGH
jgi:hypothetical protein